MNHSSCPTLVSAARVLGVISGCAGLVALFGCGCGSVVVAPPPSHSGAGGEGANATGSSTSGAGSSADGGPPGLAAVWSRRFGGDGYQSLEGFAVSPAGNVALIGRYSHTIDFGTGALPETPEGHPSLFVVGLDPAGKTVFSRSFEGADTLEDFSNPQVDRSIAFDPQGNIVVAGERATDVPFGCGTVPAAPGDVFLAKLDPQGECLWSKRFPGVLMKQKVRVAVAPSGEIVVTGIFDGKIKFGDEEVLTSGAVMAGNPRMFVARFDPEGVPLWSKKFGKANVSDVQLAVDASGSVLLGALGGAIDFGGGPFVGEDVDPHGYLARLDPAGNHLWSKHWGVSNSEFPILFPSVVAGPAGALVVAGNYGGPFDLGGGPPAADAYGGAFLATFDGQGNHVLAVFSAGSPPGLGTPGLPCRPPGCSASLACWI